MDNNKRYIKEKINDVLIILNEQTNESYLLNESATIVLESLEEGDSIEEIIEKFKTIYGNNKSYVNDIGAIIEEFKIMQII